MASFTLPPSTWLPPQELPSLAGVKKLCVDVETCDPKLTESGPGVRTGGYVAGLGIGTDDGRRWYFPVRHEGGGNLDEDLIKRWARAELGAFDGQLVGASLIYDLDYLTAPAWGIKFDKVKEFHDVQVAEALLDEWRNDYSLDEISKEYLGVGKDEDLLKRACAAYGFGNTNDAIKANLWRLPSQYVGPYAEGDVDRPLRILEMQLKKLDEDAMADIYSLERRLIPCLLAMRQRGVKVNLNKADEVRAKLVVRRDERLAHLKRLAGPKAEFMAPDSFAQALIDRGLPIERTEKTQQVSVTSKWLERNQGDELCHTIMTGRKDNTVINLFMDGHLSHAINGRIHCEFKQLKGESGGTIARLSSANPNLQNLPARDEEFATIVRGVFEPETDEIWERQDQSQVEYRLLAHFAVGDGADECRALYNSSPKTDYHKFCAEMCGIDPEDKVKRKRVKNINFAKGYGAGAERLAGQMGCSLEEAEEFIARYEAALPFTKITYDKAQTWGKNRGFVTSILGRKQRFPFWEPRNNYGNKKPAYRRERALQEYGSNIVRARCYTALNRKLQSSGADIMKKSMVDCWEAGVCNVLGAPLLTVHDEIDWSVPNTPQGLEAAAVARQLSQDVIKLKVPLIVDVERGPNWGECT